MATDTTIEAARSRIQRLVDEIAALGKADLASDQFFAQYLERVVAACDGKGGAVWLAGAQDQAGQRQFQLCAQVQFASSLFQTDEAQRGALLRILGEVVNSRRPLVFAAQQPGAAAATPAGSPEASSNKTPYPFIHVPLILKDQPVGVLQVWLQPYVQPQNYQEFVTFLASLAAHVEQHLQSRRLGNLMVESQRLQHLLRFISDIAGSIDAREVARLTANYGRDLLGCERCAVLLFEGGRWRVQAISGQEVVEQKSMLVKAMAAFVGAHAGTQTRILDKKELLARAQGPENPANGSEAAAPPEQEAETAGAPGKQIVPAAARTDAIDLAYFELSHVVSASIAPILNEDKELRGALFCESPSEGFFAGPDARGELPSSYRLAEWIANHAGRALLTAHDYQTLPLLRVSRLLQAGRRQLAADRRRRFLTRLVLWCVLLAGIALWPVKMKVVGDCVLDPVRRAAVVPEIPGRVERIAVREGDLVRKGEIIAELDTRRLQTELDAVMQEKARYLAEAERLRAPPISDEASAQVAMLQAEVQSENEKRLKAEIAVGTLRAPIDGVVLTKNLELRAGEYLAPGSPCAELAGLDDWELLIEVNERDIGLVEQTLKERGSVPVDYLLYSHSAYKLKTGLDGSRQISAQVYARDQQNVFIVTILKPGLPQDLQPLLRPGLSGRARIVLERRPFLYVTGWKILRWFRLKFFA